MSVQSHFFLWLLKLAPPLTFYTEPECEALSHYAAGKRRLIEIGCWHGVNTARLKDAMASDGILFAVDPYPTGSLGFNPQLVIAKRQIGKVANGSIKWLRMTDVEAAKLFRETSEAPVDFIFSDSENSYEGFKTCWEAWSPFIAEGGIYILANSNSTPEKPIGDAGSVRFTQEVILKDTNFTPLPPVGCFTILQRRTQNIQSNSLS